MYIIYYPFSIRNIATQRYFLRIPRGDVSKQRGGTPKEGAMVFEVVNILSWNNNYFILKYA